MIQAMIPRLKSVPLAVALMLASTAMAAPVSFGKITLDAEYSLNGGATVDGMTSPNASITNSSWWGQTEEGADLYLSDASGPSNVFFHTYGFSGVNTYFGARVSGEGVFSASTRASFSDTIVNTSGSDQVFDFTFNVDSGGVSFYGVGEALAEMLLRVKVNGIDRSRDQTTLTQSAAGVQNCVENDLGVLGGYLSCASPNSGQRTFTVNLGTFAAGESFTLDYDIISTVSGDFGSTNTDCGYGGYGGVQTAALNFEEGGGDVLDGGGGGGFCYANGGAIAQSGDPFNPFYFASNFQISSSDVPEPGSLALLGLGAVGLAAARRRQRKLP